MIVLTTSELAQAISVIPRQYESEFTLYITDDTTNTTEIYEIDDAVRQADNLTFNNIFNPVLDRKSTRLNSSHLVIAYAVFCLKKKLFNTSNHSTFLRTYYSQNLIN